MDCENFDILGRWEIDRGPQNLHYDFWWNLPRDYMADERVQRRLAAILAADVVGYTRLMIFQGWLMSAFQASQQWPTMSSKHWNTRLDNQFWRTNCQTFSCPFSSGDRGGNGRSERLVGTRRSLAP